MVGLRIRYLRRLRLGYCCYTGKELFVGARNKRTTESRSLHTQVSFSPSYSNCDRSSIASFWVEFRTEIHHTPTHPLSPSLWCCCCFFLHFLSIVAYLAFLSKLTRKPSLFRYLALLAKYTYTVCKEFWNNIQWREMIVRTTVQNRALTFISYTCFSIRCFITEIIYIYIKVFCFQITWYSVQSHCIPSWTSVFYCSSWLNTVLWVDLVGENGVKLIVYLQVVCSLVITDIDLFTSL